MDKKLFLKEVPLFCEVSDDQILKISNLTQEKFYPKNTVIFFENDPGEIFYIIISGLVKILRYSENGKTSILTILGPRDYFGEMAVIDRCYRSATAETLTDTTLLTLHKRELENLIQHSPSFVLQIIHTLSNRLRQADAIIDTLTFQKTPKRIINTLLRLAQQFGKKEEKKVVMEISLTHQEIADLSGTARETTTRTLNKLKKEKLLEFSTREIVIFDWEKLSKKIHS